MIIYVGKDLFGVKWRNWKLESKQISTDWGDPTREYATALVYDVYTDPKEEHAVSPLMMEDWWVRFPLIQALLDHAASMKKEPPIPPGTPDPYVPPKSR